mmetsp:Transcript_26642/g.40436  ORF Transcript_26642/g.40436 Transcript_26642/m.40436 type:complete len:219 (+) Transcript_26642:2223-2879(+)
MNPYRNGIGNKVHPFFRRKYTTGSSPTALPLSRHNSLLGNAPRTIEPYRIESDETDLFGLYSYAVRVEQRRPSHSVVVKEFTVMRFQMGITGTGARLDDGRGGRCCCCVLRSTTTTVCTGTLHPDVVDVQNRVGWSTNEEGYNGIDVGTTVGRIQLDINIQFYPITVIIPYHVGITIQIGLKDVFFILHEFSPSSSSSCVAATAGSTSSIRRFTRKDS